MENATTSTVTLSPDLFAEAEAYAAQQERSVEAIVEEALRAYLSVDPRLHALAREQDAIAASLGLTLAEYAVRVVKDVRAERRAA